MHIHSIAWEVSPAAERDIQIKDALSPDWIPCHQMVNSLNTGTYFVKISFCMKIIEMYMRQWNLLGINVVHHILHTSHGTEFKIKHKFWIKIFDLIQMKPSLYVNATVVTQYITQTAIIPGGVNCTNACWILCHVPLQDYHQCHSATGTLSLLAWHDQGSSEGWYFVFTHLVTEINSLVIKAKLRKEVKSSTGHIPMTDRLLHSPSLVAEGLRIWDMHGLL